MTPEERKELHWLNDMREAIRKIEEHPRFDEGQEAFETDEYYRVWVLFHIERIGECASRLRREHGYDAKHPEIDWQGAGDASQDCAYVLGHGLRQGVARCRVSAEDQGKT